MNSEIFGIIGAVMLILSFMPQVYKTYKTKNVSGLSKNFIIFQMITCVFILTYTSLNEIYPLMAANIGILLQFTILLILKIIYDKNSLKTFNENNENKEKIVINDMRTSSV